MHDADLSLKRELPLILTVMAFCLFYITFIVEVFDQTAHVFKATPLIALILLFPKRRPDALRARFILLFTALILYGYILVIGAEDFYYSLSFTSKYFMRPLFFFALILTLHADFNTDRIVRAFMWLGVLLSLQGFMAFILTYVGVGLDSRTTINDGLYVIWSPLWGNTGGSLNQFILRVASYFREASLFGCFLEFCFWMSIGYATLYRNRKYLFAAVVCFFGIVSTFSLAAMGSLILSGLALAVVRLYRPGQKPVWIVKVSALAAGVAFATYLVVMSLNQDYRAAFNSHQITEQAQQVNLVTLAFGRYGDPRVTSGGAGRLPLIERTMAIFAENPFGIGIIDPKASSVMSLGNVSATAPVLWLVWVGVPGFCLLLFIVLYGISLNIRAIRDPRDLRGYLVLAFISQSVHHLVYGTWMDPFFLFILACIVVTVPGYFVLSDPLPGRS